MNVNYEFSDKLEGEVLEQSPEAGEEVVVKNTEVTLTVSEGVKTVEVRNLKDYNEANRKEYERSSGFKIIKAGEKYC